MKPPAAAIIAAALAAAFAGPAGAAEPRVAGLQVALRAQGLYQGPVDGIHGPQTRLAVTTFQRRVGLAVDGVAGPRTRRALGPLGRPKLGRRPVVPGSLGWDVSVLQFMLKQRGFDPGPLDGYMGKRTTQALIAYQRRRGLLVDGIAGPMTLAALSGRAVGGPARPASRPRFSRVVVRRGDTLSALAVRYGTTIAALARANGLDPRGILLQGARLRVPAGRARPAAAGPRAAGLDVSPAGVRAFLDHWSRHYGVDPSLVRALAWMESGFQTNLTSPAGAWGVMQIIPATWDFVEEVLLGRRVPRTAEGNVRVGVLYLRHLLRRFNGNERLALAAWYQGERAVREHGVYAESKWFARSVLALRRRGV